MNIIFGTNIFEFRALDYIGILIFTQFKEKIFFDSKIKKKLNSLFLINKKLLVGN